MIASSDNVSLVWRQQVRVQFPFGPEHVIYQPDTCDAQWIVDG